MILGSVLSVQSNHLGTYKMHTCPEPTTDQLYKISVLQCFIDLPQVIFVCSLVERYQVRGNLPVPIETFEDIPKEFQRRESGNKVQKIPHCNSPNPWIIYFGSLYNLCF